MAISLTERSPNSRRAATETCRATRLGPRGHGSREPVRRRTRLGQNGTAPGHRPGRKAGALIVLVDGKLALYVERAAAPAAFVGRKRRVRTAADALALAVRDGTWASFASSGPTARPSPHPRVKPSQAGFHVTPRGLRYAAEAATYPRCWSRGQPQLGRDHEAARRMAVGRVVVAVPGQPANIGPPRQHGHRPQLGRPGIGTWRCQPAITSTRVCPSNGPARRRAGPATHPAPAPAPAPAARPATAHTRYAAGASPHRPPGPRCRSRPRAIAHALACLPRSRPPGDPPPRHCRPTTANRRTATVCASADPNSVRPWTGRVRQRDEIPLSSRPAVPTRREDRAGHDRPSPDHE